MAHESLNQLMETGFDPPDRENPGEQLDKRCMLAVLNQHLDKLKSSTEPSKWRMIESLLCDRAAINASGKERVARHRARMFLRNHLMKKRDAILKW